MSTKTTKNKPRTIDPEILTMRAKHAANVSASKAAQKSAAILTRITDELVPKLTWNDLGKLQLAISNIG